MPLAGEALGLLPWFVGKSSIIPAFRPHPSKAMGAESACYLRHANLHAQRPAFHASIPFEAFFHGLPCFGFFVH